MSGTSANGNQPKLTLPQSEQLQAYATTAVAGVSYADSFAQDNAGSLFLGITDTAGGLYGFYPAAGNAAPVMVGAGGHTISFQGSYADIQAILNSLTYAAAGSPGTDNIHFDIWNQGGVETAGTLPVSVAAGTNAASGGVANPGTTSSASPANSGTAAATSSGPSLSEPASETVAAGATLPVSGSYSDSTAAGNPGAMYLSISDSSGILRATNAAGAAVAGSGSNNITLNAGYADVNAVLKSLTYTAGGTPGSDSIQFDLWDQGGTETTGNVPVAITSGGGSVSETWTGAVSGDWNTAGNWSGGVVPGSGGTAIIPNGVTNTPTLSNATLSGETITLQGGTVDFNNVVLNALLDSSGGGGAVQVGGTLTIGSAGTLTPNANDTLSLTGSAETIVNNGLVLTQPTGILDIYNAASATSASAAFLNNGSVVVGGGTMNLASAPAYTLPGSLPDWTLVNAGGVGVGIGSNGNFMLNGTVSGGAIAFTGTGGLSLEQPLALTGGAVVTGFGTGDQLDLYGNAGDGGALSFANGTLDVVAAGGTLQQAVPLAGSFTTGNFEQRVVGGPGNAGEVVYAPGNAGSGMLNPDIVAPASATMTQGTTLALNDVSIENLGTSGGMTISAATGTLYMNGATGSGTHQVAVSSASTTQLNADLASLTYVAAAGASADTVSIGVYPPAPVETTRAIPISITSGGGGGGGSSPALHEPASESVAASGTVAVDGSYSDSFAAQNPGSLFLGISDSSGTLSATDASGQAVAGSGTSSIAVQTGYVDVNAILASLHYTAGASAGSDSIQFDVWNQAGTETTGSTAVTISAVANGTSASMADFATPGSAGSGTVPPADTGSGTTGSTLLASTPAHPIGLPLTPGS